MSPTCLHVVLALLTVSVGYAAPNFGNAMLGYMGDPDGPRNIIEDPEESPQVNEGLVSFQRQVGLEPSGKLDSETLEWMERSKLGLQVRERKSGLNRRKRGISDSKWNTTNLTYRVSQYPRSLPKAQVDQALAEALQVWSNVSSLKFTMMPQGPVHIDVKFLPFDGRRRHIAHSYYPEQGGSVHFNDDETWTLGSDGFNLMQGAVHEFGHALGLRHSRVNGSAMYHSYVYSPNFKLHPDDIQSIQLLYGNTETSTGHPTKPGTTDNGEEHGIDDKM